MGPDIRDSIFSRLADQIATARVTVEGDGVVFGLEEAQRQAEAVGLTVTGRAVDGSFARWGDAVLAVEGVPKAIVRGEEVLLGVMAKASGIATAAFRAACRAGGRVQIVSGAWKKMPPELKETVRNAMRAGGVRPRISDAPFIYLDKNYIRLLGGIRRALEAAAAHPGYVRVIQVRGEEAAIADEAVEAAAAGANVVMIDTGDAEDIARVSERLRALGMRERVQIAFAGGIGLDDIDALAAHDVDILDVGAAIVDAPLLPMRFDVTQDNRAAEPVELNLLEKTELWIRPIELSGADLREVGRAVAESLAMSPDEVLVTDVRDDVLCLDILRRDVTAEQIAGKRRALLERLAHVPGVVVSGETGVHSEGVLGLIELDESEAVRLLESGRALAKRLNQAIARRAIVFSTGAEVLQRSIRDTNSEYIATTLRSHGLRCATGPVLPDDAVTISGAIRRAAAEGYGLVITTGGVGAEDKDRTIEGILALDPDAATPYIARFRAGSGRHVKDGVRIAVGELDGSLVVALPGPNEEVRIAIRVLMEGLRIGLSKKDLADRLAESLREVLRRRMASHAYR